MAYGIKYKCQFASNAGSQIKAYILKKDYDSAQIDIRMSGDPVTISYTGDEVKFDIIRGSECKLEFFSEYNGQFTEIMIADAMDFMIQIWKDNIMIWQGFVIQDNYSEPYLAAPYLISIRATDGLGNLKHNDFQGDDDSFYLNTMTFIEVIQKCLSKLKNATQLVTAVDVFESRIVRTDPNNESLNSLTVNPYLFVKDDLNSLTCDVVLTYILEIFNCYIYYKEGKYWIERINYKLKDTITRRYYNINFDGSLSGVITVNNENIVKNIGRTSGLIPVNGDQNITRVPPYQKIQIDSDVITVDNIVVNSYFRNWNTAINVPYNWLKTGTFAIEKVNDPNSGDFIHVTQKTQNDADINYTTNKLSAQKINFTGSPTDNKTLSIKFASFGNARFMVKASTATETRWLSCTSNVDSGQLAYVGAWKDVPSFCKIERSDTNGTDATATWFVSEINDMAIPAVTSIEFSLLPSYDTQKTTSARPPVTYTYNYGYRVREFTPTISDTVSTVVNGQRYTVASNKVNREVYTDLQPSIGEFGNLTLVNQIAIAGAYSLNWYRDGVTESRSLLDIAALSILNQYRTAFIQFTGSLMGNFDFGAVYKIAGLDNKYMPYTATMSLKSDIIDVALFELLPDTDDLTDVHNRQVNYKGDYTVRANPTATSHQGRGN